MTKEQKKLLYKIAKWHSKDFYNHMVDNWTEKNYDIDTECAFKIRQLEKKYKETYGDLPEWRYIDDVLAAIKTLEKDMGV